MGHNLGLCYKQMLITIRFYPEWKSKPTLGKSSCTQRTVASKTNDTIHSHKVVYISPANFGNVSHNLN